VLGDKRRRFRQAVGARVRTLRARHGWSQEDLADRAGLHRTFVGAVERGQRGMNYDRLPDLAIALEVEPYALIPGWEAFTGSEPRDSWSVPLGLTMPEHARHEYNQRRLQELLEETERRVGPVPEEVKVAVDAEWRAALAAAGGADDEG
jgi:transcriptional regulator with XRE-family HTH domain